MRPFIAFGLVIALVGAGSLPARAADGESPLDFILNQQKLLDRKRAVEPAIIETPQIASVPTQRTYCVRTCDGYYFAIGFVKNERDLAQHAAMCTSACTGAPTQLYTTPLVARDPAAEAGAAPPAIEEAMDAMGQPYTALPTAYGFRNGFSAACTCQGVANGLPRIPLEADPTLRDGDVVVMADGLKVFKGQRDGPHNPEDFVPVSDGMSLSRIVREQILSLENRIAQ